jgi:hypothetical protein
VLLWEIVLRLTFTVSLSRVRHMSCCMLLLRLGLIALLRLSRVTYLFSCHGGRVSVLAFTVAAKVLQVLQLSTALALP